MTTPMPQALHLSGTYLYQLIPGLPDLSGLKVLHPGWWLGTVKTGRFEPSHALALGAQPGHIQQTVDFEPADPLLLTYLRGGSLPIPGEAGWVLMTVAGYPLGWGKRSNQVIKNAYPRGLRWSG
jgi:NOL1/NOP2/fmu family ribosome biogenesis protein